jgi:hypothetical protein
MFNFLNLNPRPLCLIPDRGAVRFGGWPHNSILGAQQAGKRCLQTQSQTHGKSLCARHLLCVGRERICDFLYAPRGYKKTLVNLLFVRGRPIMLYRLGLHGKDVRSRFLLYALFLPLLACPFFCANAALLAVAWWRWWRRRAVISFRERERERSKG